MDILKNIIKSFRSIFKKKKSRKKKTSRKTKQSRTTKKVAKKTARRKIPPKKTAKKKTPVKKKTTKKKAVKTKATTKKKTVKKKTPSKPKSKKAVKTKVPAKTTAKKSTRKSPSNKNEELIGVITHYFSKIEVGVIKVQKASILIGDNITIRGKQTDFTQKVSSLQIESVDVKMARKGKLAGLKLSKPAKVGDKVYKVK
ncbi:MAG: hypothetical protein KC684_10250 [Candidatus Omnitrophica bacterium]|nr:hypothetical protein [Candidatus Omnitrophota bacterium]